jgi:hypothetical protein
MTEDEIIELLLTVDKLRNALIAITNLPCASLDDCGCNEWTEAESFADAVAIAEKALK